MNKIFLNKRIFIKKYNTLHPNGYNLSPKGGVHIPGCFSEETIQKFREDRKGSKNSFYGKHPSERSLEILRKPKSREHVLKIAEKHKKKIINILTGEIYLSIGDGAKLLNMNYWKFRAQLAGKNKNKTNFKYFEESN